MLPVVLVLACVACAIDACGGAGWRRPATQCPGGTTWADGMVEQDVDAEETYSERDIRPSIHLQAAPRHFTVARETDANCDGSSRVA